MLTINKFTLEGTHIQIIADMYLFTKITMLISTPSLGGKPAKYRLTLFVPNDLIEQYKNKFDSLLSFGVEGFIRPRAKGRVNFIATSFKYIGGTINE